GFRAQSLAAGASMSPERIDRGLLELHWKETPRQTAGEPAEDTGAWVVFADSTGVADEMATTLRADGRRVFRVAHGDVEEPRDEGGDVYTINAANPAHYQHLMRSLDDHAISRVIHLWSLDADFDETRSAEDLEALQETGVLSVLWLMQALSQAQDRQHTGFLQGLQILGRP